MPWKLCTQWEAGKRTWGVFCGDPIGLGGFWKHSFKLPLLSLQIWAFDWMACSLGRHWPARRDFHTNEALLGVFQMVQWTNLDFKKKYCKPNMYNESQIFQTRSKSGSMDIYNSMISILYIWHIIAYLNILLINSQNPKIPFSKW